MPYALLRIFTHALYEGRLANYFAYVLIYHIIPEVRGNHSGVVGTGISCARIVLTFECHQRRGCQIPFFPSAQLRLVHIASVETWLSDKGQDGMTTEVTKL